MSDVGILRETVHAVSTTPAAFEPFWLDVADVCLCVCGGGGFIICCSKKKTHNLLRFEESHLRSLDDVKPELCCQDVLFTVQL